MLDTSTRAPGESLYSRGISTIHRTCSSDAVIRFASEAKECARRLKGLVFSPSRTPDSFLSPVATVEAIYGLSPGSPDGSEDSFGFAFSALFSGFTWVGLARSARADAVRS